MKKNEYALEWRQAIPQAVGVGAKIRELARNIALNLISATVSKQAERYLRCLYCHYVFDDQLEVFENLIIYLKKMGTFINTDRCLKMLQGKDDIDGRYFHLSFDDGFMNNFINAMPILRRHNVPAIFFVPSSLVGASYEVAEHYCLRTTSYIGVIEIMGWREVKELLKEGFEVGSHTKTHVRFSAISSSKQLMETEILGSKYELEDQLGVECKYISWPYGRLSDADSVSLEMVKRAGYDACFGAYRGSLVPGKTHPYSIPRHHFETQWPLSHVGYFARGNMEVKI